VSGEYMTLFYVDTAYSPNACNRMLPTLYLRKRLACISLCRL